MGTRVNLFQNPALKVNATGWFSPGDPGNWARITGASATLPRQTAFSGTDAGDFATEQILNIVAGASYVISWSMFATAAQAGITGVDWYDETGFLAGTGASAVAFTINTGATQRVEAGPFVAPTGATRLAVWIEGIDGPAQITAMLVEQTATLGLPYFDGDTPGATWAGNPGNSRSYLLTGADTWTVGESAALTESIPGPSRIEPVGWGEAATGAAVGGWGDALGWTELALIVATGYDERYGRIRVEASGFPPDTLRAVVYHRPATSSVWEEVRGGRVSVSGGGMARFVDDYEFTAGVTMLYKIVGLATTEGVPDIVTASAVVRRETDMAGIWLKFIAAPFLNRRLKVIGWSPLRRSSRNAAYDVQGRRTPVVTTDVHSSRSVEITVETFDGEATDDLDEALRSGYAVFLHTPTSVTLPTMYAAIGDYQWAPPAPRSHRARFEIPLTEVTAPPPSVVGNLSTYQVLLSLYTSYADLLDSNTTYGALL